MLIEHCRNEPLFRVENPMRILPAHRARKFTPFPQRIAIGSTSNTAP